MSNFGQGFIVQPSTGLRSIGFRKDGSPIFPILGGADDGDNPAWDDFLNYVPEDKRDEVKPLLERWDSGVQEKLSSVRSEMDPWKPIMDSGADPETATFAINLLSTLETDPRAVYDALGKQYGWSQAQIDEAVDDAEKAGDKSGGTSTSNLVDDPEFKKVQQANELMANILLKQREEETEAAEDAELDSHLSELSKQYGEFDEMWVYGHMDDEGNDGDLEKTVQAYHEWVDGIRKSRRKAPTILGGGGNIPAATIDPRKLDDKGTRNLVAQMLEQASQGG